MNAKVTRTITVGSSAFFSGMPGYSSKDTDKVCLIDCPVFKDSIMNIRQNGEDLFFVYDGGKEMLLAQCLKSDNPMAAGKFLVPDLVNHIGLTIDDVKRLGVMFNKIDEKHSYEKIIYDAYIENGGFFLTEAQRSSAYEKYKQDRC